MDKRTAEQLRRNYPDYIPLDVAAKYLGVSRRQLSWLIAEGREPYASVGGNIGKKQRYARVYTEPLIALLCGIVRLASKSLCAGRSGTGNSAVSASARQF